VRELSEEQRRVVEADSGRYIIEARPGCGKTTTIAHRIAALAKGRSGGESGTLCLTHSRAAVAAMTRYTEDLAGPIRAPTIIATFHSFAESVLRSYGHLVGLRSLTLLDTDEARVIALRTALEGEGEANAAIDPHLLEAISARLRHSTLEPPKVGIGKLTFDEVVSAYVEFLEATESVDFDLLLIKAIEVLSANSSVRNHYQRMYRHIIVDETQDTSKLQLDLLAQVIGAKTLSVAMFIDPDQRVSSWLGVPDGLSQLLTETYDLSTIELTINFRNETGILMLANSIRHSTPFAKLDGVEFAVTSGDREEGKRVTAWVQEIRDLIDEQPSIAVLGRSRWLLAQAEFALLDAGIPVWNPSEKHNLFSTSEFRMLLPILRWLSSPDNAVTRRELSVQLGVSEEANDEDVSREYAKRYPNVSILSEAIHGPQTEALVRLEQAAKTVFESTVDSDDDESQALDDDLRRTVDSLRTYRLASGSGTLDWSAVYQALTAPTARPSKSVWVGSIHAAKGLEFDAVAIVGLTEGGLPDFRSKSIAQVREERRLFYVAVTRARKKLLITRCQERSSKAGSPYSVQPSRFLKDIGQA
jgi:DNA helicase II / ATP-dependent DNA helicase PcrA